jgi:transposase
METLITHCAGMDVHQKNIVVCVMAGKNNTSLVVETRTFSTMTRE